jgi:hypothetical protein
LAYLSFYPAVGFLLAWTGYHGVTVVIPFFILAFMCLNACIGSRSQAKKIVFWVMIVLTMGKEQLLYILMYGVFIALVGRFKI